MGVNVDSDGEVSLWVVIVGDNLQVQVQIIPFSVVAAVVASHLCHFCETQRNSGLFKLWDSILELKIFNSRIKDLQLKYSRILIFSVTMFDRKDFTHDHFLLISQFLSIEECQTILTLNKKLNKFKNQPCWCNAFVSSCIPVSKWPLFSQAKEVRVYGNHKSEDFKIFKKAKKFRFINNNSFGSGKFEAPVVIFWNCRNVDLRGIDAQRICLYECELVDAVIEHDRKIEELDVTMAFRRGSIKGVFKCDNLTIRGGSAEIMSGGEVDKLELANHARVQIADDVMRNVKEFRLDNVSLSSIDGSHQAKYDSATLIHITDSDFPGSFGNCIFCQELKLKRVIIHGCLQIPNAPLIVLDQVCWGDMEKQQSVGDNQLDVVVLIRCKLRNLIAFRGAKHVTIDNCLLNDSELTALGTLESLTLVDAGVITHEIADSMANGCKRKLEGNFMYVEE